MPRIIVIGCGGAGKSRVSTKLGKMLDIPVVHLDKIYWKPNWKHISREEFVVAQKSLLEGPNWIIDGNYGATLDLRIAASDTIIFLDTSTYLCLWNVVTRWIRYNLGDRQRPDMTEGNTERLTREYLVWILGYRQKRRPGILKRLSDVKGQKDVVILRSRNEIREYLKPSNHLN